MQFKRFFISMVAISASVTSLAQVKWQTGIGYQYGNTIYAVSSETDQQHGPSNLFKENNQAWCMRGNKGYIRVVFDSRMKFANLLIKNGDQESPEAFQNHARAKTIKVSGRKSDEKLTLQDNMGMQVVRLKKPMWTRWLRVDILDTYPGKTDVTCLSLMRADLDQHNRA